MRVALVGGTGAQGLGLALRFAKGGATVVLGSRQTERAQHTAALVATRIPHARVTGTHNAEAAAQAEIVVITVPYCAHRQTIEALSTACADKIVVDVTVPLDPTDVTQRDPCAKLSAAEQCQATLGATVPVIAAFQTLSARSLTDLRHPVLGDALVCGDDPGATERVCELAVLGGMRPVRVGGLNKASVLESMAALALSINKLHKVRHASFQVAGID